MNSQQPAAALVPPDGGWGWMIVLAYAITNIVIAPTVGSFGLIFADKFTQMQMSATDMSLITNVNAAFAMSMGLVNGPLLRKFGYRKIGFVAGIFISGGMIWTAFANTFIEFMLFYGILTAAGLGLAVSAFSLALNSYFKEKRNKAVGVSMTIAGLGPIFYPPLISVLLVYYGVTGCVMLLGAMCLHVLAAALLLHPIKWHMKNAPPGDLELQDIVQPLAASSSLHSLPGVAEETKEKERKLIEADHFVDGQSIYGMDHMTILHTPSVTHIERTFSFTTAPAASRVVAQQPPFKLPSARGRVPFERSISHVMYRPQLNNNEPISPLSLPVNKPLRWFESGSVDSVNLGSSVDVFSEDAKSRVVSTVPTNAGRSPDTVNGRREDSTKRPSVVSTVANTIPEETLPDDDEKKNTCLTWLVKFFDLDLFKDSVYVNIMIGMSLAIFAELNFTILTPFIFNALGFTSLQIASFLSVLAIADIAARFTAPFVGDCFKQPPRIMYMISLVMLIVTRLSILLASTYQTMMISCVFMGIAKGVRVVYMNLVIPSYVPLERLAAASGLQMVMNGIVIMALGPVVGMIRDLTGSYTRCIMFINAVTALTLVLWTVELIYRRCRRRAQPEVQSVGQQPADRNTIVT